MEQYKGAEHTAVTALAEHVSIACSLAVNYKDLIELEKAAKRGLFLRDLLEKFGDPDHVENTVLQLYLIDRQDNFSGIGTKSSWTITPPTLQMESY